MQHMLVTVRTRLEQLAKRMNNPDLPPWQQETLRQETHRLQQILNDPDAWRRAQRHARQREAEARRVQRQQQIEDSSLLIAVRHHQEEARQKEKAAYELHIRHEIWLESIDITLRKMLIETRTVPRRRGLPRDPENNGQPQWWEATSYRKDTLAPLHFDERRTRQWRLA